MYHGGVVGRGTPQQSHPDAVALDHVTIETRDPNTGLTQHHALPDVAALDVEGGLPVREPASYHGQWSKPGWFYMATLDRLIGYESLFEAWVLLDLDFSGTCAQVLPQPCRIHFARREAPYRHVPDYLVRHRDGERHLVDVKGARQAAKPKNRLVFDLTRTISEEVGWRFTVAQEPASAYFRNVRFLAGVRHPRWAGALDEPAHDLITLVASRGSMRWDEAERWLRPQIDPWLVPRVVTRGLWTRGLLADLGTPLHAGSVLTAAEGSDALVVAGMGVARD